MGFPIACMKSHHRSIKRGQRPSFPRTVGVPAALASVIAVAGFLPQMDPGSPLSNSFVGVGAALLIWSGLLWLTSEGRKLKFEWVPRPQHYLQAIAHCSIFVYWGIYWQPLRHAAGLIAAQIA